MAIAVGTKAPDFSLKSKQASGVVDVKPSNNLGKKNTVVRFSRWLSPAFAPRKCATSPRGFRLTRA